MRTTIWAIGMVLVTLLGVELMPHAVVAETQDGAQKTATCTLQVTGMT